MKNTKLKPVKDTKLTGYPAYPESEDIYKKDIETELDPEKLAEIPVKTESGTEEESLKQKGTTPDSGLDVPGAELDDEAEETGNEDEENNYYSLGGDSNTALEEDN
ncbi:MAG: hypothetical protein IAE93_02730 [Ignavibacteria bacterium]|nr:hypothetical protein [Ignavibacteria bacterium]